jgi:predicted Na+-dependent transporter
VKIINAFFEYMYYRIAKVYLKKDGSEGITAIFGISLCQTLLLGDVIIFIVRLFLHRSETTQYTKLASTIGVILLILICILNFSKYRNKYDEYQMRWGNEKQFTRRLRGILVIIALILPLIIGIYFGRVQL